MDPVGNRFMSRWTSSLIQHVPSYIVIGSCVCCLKVTADGNQMLPCFHLTKGWTRDRSVFTQEMDFGSWDLRKLILCWAQPCTWEVDTYQGSAKSSWECADWFPSASCPHPSAVSACCPLLGLVHPTIWFLALLGLAGAWLFFLLDQL